MPSTLTPDGQGMFLGYYGKVPTHGDFVGKGLPRSFREPWDAWMQGVMNTTRQQMGHMWIQHYLTCPLYRFALSPGICGAQAWLGVVIPSVDQVGRYYPMTLCRSVVGLSNLLEIMPKYGSWFAQAENLVLSCLDDAFALDTFDQQLRQMERDMQTRAASGDDDATSLQRSIQKYAGAAWRMSLSDLGQMRQAMPGLLDSLVQDFCFAYSLWWTGGSEDIAASFMLTKGLPPFEGAAAMLDGNWQQWGWNNGQGG